MNEIPTKVVSDNVKPKATGTAMPTSHVEKRNEHGPAEFKTDNFQKLPLYSATYLHSKNGDAVSFQRVYKAELDRMLKIKKFVYEFSNQYKETRKLPLKQISTSLKIPYATVSATVQKMCGLRRIMRKENNLWVTIIKGPMLAMQQKDKHIDPKYWGRRTPIYVYTKESVLNG